MRKRKRSPRSSSAGVWLRREEDLGGSPSGAILLRVVGSGGRVVMLGSWRVVAATLNDAGRAPS